MFLTCVQKISSWDCHFNHFLFRGLLLAQIIIHSDSIPKIAIYIYLDALWWRPPMSPWLPSPCDGSLTSVLKFFQDVCPSINLLFTGSSRWEQLWHRTHKCRADLFGQVSGVSSFKPLEHWFSKEVSECRRKQGCKRIPGNWESPLWNQVCRSI